MEPSEYYDRRFELLVDDEIFIEQMSLVQFKVVFNILIDYGGAHSYADIAIYGLTDDTVGEIFKKGKKIEFRAGYAETIDRLFKGRIKNIFKERQGADRITRIIARGGSQPQAIVNRTLGQGATVVELIRECAKAMGYPLIMTDDDFKDIKPYKRGYAMNGDPVSYLDRLSKAHDFKYVVENERLVVTRTNSYRKGEPIEISQFNGMEGIPEITEVGCNVTTRLNPKLRIGKRIDVQTDYATFNFNNVYFQNVPGNAGKGIYRIFRVRHSGDTYGDKWSTSIVSYR